VPRLRRLDETRLHPRKRGILATAHSANARDLALAVEGVGVDRLAERLERRDFAGRPSLSRADVRVAR
jgi:hypothetical protein